MDVQEVGHAHQWHADFASTNSAIFPRSRESFAAMVLDRSVWCAINDDGKLFGLSYAHLDESANEWEIGGLMVHPEMGGKGLGTVLMAIPLVSMLFNERPLSWQPVPRIVTHVLEGNEAPRGIIPRVGFVFDRAIRVPGKQLPGLPTDSEGFVHGDEFTLQIPEGIEQVASWCEEWRDELRDHTSAAIQLPDGLTMGILGGALRQMIAET